MYSSGRVDFSVSRVAGSSVGNYTVTYTSAYPNNNYVISATAIGNTADAGVGSAHSASAASIFTWTTSSGNLFDSSFYFFVF